MAKAVFTTKVEPTYDDLPEFRYHFPRSYLRQAEAAVGDWAVYYEPRRSSGDLSSSGGRQAYFATARVNAIEPDPNRPDHFYAFVSDYLEFDEPVPFHATDFYYESALQRDDGETNKGAFGRAVRTVPDREYDLILRAGFAEILRPPANPAQPEYALAEEQEAFERPIVERLVARPFRDAAFATAVKAAYENTCAVTGLKIINGGGRAVFLSADAGVWPVTMRWRRFAFGANFPWLHKTFWTSYSLAEEFRPVEVSNSGESLYGNFTRADHRQSRDDDCRARYARVRHSEELESG